MDLRPSRSWTGFASRAAVALLGAGLAVGATVSLFSSSEALAAKIRKKPPVRPLPRGIQTLPPEDAGAASPLVEDASIEPVVTSHPASSSSSRPAAVPSERVHGLRCLYGRRVDEKGQIRCLSPEELNPPVQLIIDTSPIAEQLGMLDHTQPPVPPLGAVRDGGLDGDVDADDSPFEVRVARVSFENGYVGGIKRALKDDKRALEACVEEAGGLPKQSARLKLLFFVRRNRRASGMIVASARNVPRKIVRCIQKVVKRQRFGVPSTSAVGVKLLLELKERDD